MIVVVARPLRVRDRLDGGKVYDLVPGQPASLPDDLALRLLAKVPERVRPAPGPAPVTVGCRVTWDSPLFGLLEGVVLARTATTVTVHHPLTGREATIPAAWVTAIEEAAT